MNELDKNVLKDLSNFEVKLDKTELWAAIESKQRKKAGLGYFAWLLGTGLIILMVYVTLPGTLQFTAELAPQKAQTEELVDLVNPINSNASTISNSQQKDQLTKAIPSTTNTKINILTPSTLNQSFTSKSNNLNSLSHLFGQDKFYSTQELLKNNASSGDFYSKNLLSSATFNKTATIASIVNTNSNNYTTVTPNNQATIKEKDTKSASSFSANLSPTKQLKNTALNFVNSFDLNDNTYPKANVAFTKALKHNPWVFNLDVAYGYTQKSLEAKAVENNPYLLERLRTEKLKEEILINAGFRYQYTNGFYVKFGLEAAQWVEEYANTSETIEQVTVDNTTTTVVVNPDGSTQNITGTGTGVLTTYNEQLLYNQYQSLDVPFLVGFSSTSGRWQYAVEAGLSVNAWFGTDGMLLDEESNLVATSNFYKESLGLSATGSAFIKYRMTHNAALYMGPSIKRPFKSMELAEYGITQKMLFYRWRLGLEYRL